MGHDCAHPEAQPRPFVSKSMSQMWDYVTKAHSCDPGKVRGIKILLPPGLPFTNNCCGNAAPR